MENIHSMNDILSDLKIDANCIDIKILDNYLYYDIILGKNTKVKDIQNFENEISLKLKTISKIDINIISSEGIVRLGHLKKTENTLLLKKYLINQNYPSNNIPCLLGQNMKGDPVWMDLSENPHLLIGGATNSGKSTLLHNIIANILYKKNILLYLVDTKQIEFSRYSNVRNTEFVDSYEDSLDLIENLISIMEDRFSLLREGYDNFPYIVFIIDEFADLILQDTKEKLYKSLCQLAQKCRAAKISIVIATQRPSAKIINGNIKANFPARIACKTASKIDSRIILDNNGAENLLGRGDSLLLDQKRFLERFQVAYVNPENTIKDMNEE
jgi:S-DNA-T family DNA segregation ATPase FtsK/SpoIIIE